MLKVRMADKMDSNDIFAWRNDKVTRAMSRTGDRVDWQAHRRWFDKTLDDANRYLLVCTTLDEEKVAVVRFDICDTVALISVNVSPAMRGKGLSKPCLKEAIDYFKSLSRHVSVINAEIKTENIASRKAFEGAAFVLDHELDGYSRYTLVIPAAS